MVRYEHTVGFIRLAPSTISTASGAAPNFATISVGSANVWFNQGARVGQPPLQAINAFLQNIPLDVLLFQETKDVDIETLSGYQVIYNEGYREHEKMGCILKSNSPWQLTSWHRHETRLAKSGIFRRSMITRFRLKADHSVQCSIGNVHLCGGEVDERFAQAETNLEHLRQTKNEALDAMISAGVDIIAELSPSLAI